MKIPCPFVALRENVSLMSFDLQVLRPAKEQFWHHYTTLFSRAE